MNDLHSWFFASWVLCYLTISKCSDVIVQSFEGERVILPCKYDSKYHGKCHICWTIGDIPNMGCGNEIIGSDGDKVVRKISSRYQLAGEIQRGDVSLTILNIEKKDSGKYGCRIHVPGLFNDEMYYVHLIVNDVETNTTQESASFAFSTNPPKSRTFGLWLSDTTYETSFDHRESSSMEKKDSVNTSAVIVPVILLLLALIVIAVILILKQKKKNRAAVDITQNSENSVIYSNSGSSVGLYNREMAVENIYQIQAENEYEQWH
ncbi:T-cell immunoglobulin and mucin domain-containing protein 4-like isoform X3 [Sinocyclocheilus anshuiensis]|uniref:T-cell immunoglobulin and mucin domain-containing protein 4-like n=1 Tax=Sinocyclocheilus anshuiensis TaxID=1608454 RepID=A0A671MX10_9TELE|nr:PREDICTED: T-cell immunoglobulin and mucin domain-containing protein 4-like isoform X3 [Sinocyclocheilus anshuiensis]